MGVRSREVEKKVFLEDIENAGAGREKIMIYDETHKVDVRRTWKEFPQPNPTRQKSLPMESIKIPPRLFYEAFE